MDNRSIVRLIHDDGGTLLGIRNCTVSIPCSSCEIDRAALSDFYSDRGVDADADGKYEHLEVGVVVAVVEAGNCTIDAYLVGNETTFFVANSVCLDQGNNTVNLIVDGSHIRNTWKNQSYSLVSVSRIYSEGRVI